MPAGVHYSVSVGTERWVSSPFLLPVCVTTDVSAFCDTSLNQGCPLVVWVDHYELVI